MSELSIKQIENQIKKEFDSLSDDWQEKYGYLIELGKNLPPLDHHFKTEECLVKGCQSQAWLHIDQKDGKLIIKADSDALIVKGLLALVVRILDGQDLNEVKNWEPDIFEKIELYQHLSPSRVNGLQSVIKNIRNFINVVQIN